MQLPVPAHAPLQPTNSVGPDGVVVSATTVPDAKRAAQLPEARPPCSVHAIPAGDDVTVPSPEPVP